ncbi:flagellar assembly protein FliW [Heliobacillus mobilis]|uniref:Flagellar assembly factor FliW n=1 Tax=Heliobacterium mobile TaxID=28064 RepID=A0A6I3SM19_HELMO|nr:flagellar assembly protein FliW [Heliobacterium mobile]MTV49929.1 flagellar assembly protein FliW [Heliobacterium mobile]
MRIQTERFGELNISREEILRFSHGLPGFLKEVEFVLIPHGEDSPFAFLQSLMTPQLAFLVVNPFVFFPDYNAPIHINQISHIGINEANIGEIWTIVTVPENLENMTTNLLAPIVINRKNGEAVQVVLDKTNYTTKHRLFTAATKASAGNAGKGGE